MKEHCEVNYVTEKDLFICSSVNNDYVFKNNNGLYVYIAPQRVLSNFEKKQKDTI